MAVELPGRFQTAIDRAAMVAGCHTYSEYIEEWRRIATPCSQDVDAEAKAAAARIEQDFPNERLFRIAANGGFDESAVSPETLPDRSKDRTP